MGAKSSVATERRPSAPRGKRRSFSVGRKGTESQSAWVPPSPEEATLVQRLAPGTSPREGPPYYAIAESWLSIWRVFALEGGIRPGPIENDKLLNTSRSQDICWLSAADWHSLYGRYGGGPILCRHTKQLFVSTQPVNAGEGEMPASVRATSSRGLLEELSPRSGSASSSSPEALLRKACNALTWKCRDIETSLRDEVERLENGPWRAKTPKAQAPKVQASKAIVAARQRVCQAVKATCGGEELKSALQDLASLNREDPELRGLEAKVYDLCAHEEAQIVLVILLQAVQEADRLGLEMWLEEARGVELLVGNMDIYEPLRKTLSELEEREKRALAGHAATTENEEEPAERLWRQVQFAVEANDEDTLMMLIEEAQERGIDASVAWMAWEELRHRREEAEGHSTIPPPPRPRAGTSSPSGQPRADDARHKSRGTIPGNAPRRGSAWHQQQEDIDDDFLNRYKKWRADQRAEREAGQSSYRPFSQADREGESEAEASRARVEAERKRVREAEARRRQEREEEEEERRRQEDEESKRRAAFEAEREQRRRRQRFDHTTPPSGQPQNRGFAPSAQAQRQDGQGRAKSLTDEMEVQLRQTRYQPLETRKRIFKDLQLRLHPDKNPDNPQAAKTAFQALMEKRQEYLAP